MDREHAANNGNLKLRFLEAYLISHHSYYRITKEFESVDSHLKKKTSNVHSLSLKIIQLGSCQ